MAHASKKSSGHKGAGRTGHAAGRFANPAASKAAHATLAAVESSRHSAENILRMGSDAVRGFLSTGTGEGGRVQEKLLSVGREAAEQFSRSAETASRGLNECATLGRDNIEAFVELSGVATNVSKELGSEVFNYLNDVFSQNVEMSKEAFSCRTVNDLFELSNRAAKSNIEGFFNQSMRLSEMFFQYASEAAEPISERMSEATERLGKALAA